MRENDANSWGHQKFGNGPLVIARLGSTGSRANAPCTQGGRSRRRAEIASFRIQREKGGRTVLHLLISRNRAASAPIWSRALKVFDYIRAESDDPEDAARMSLEVERQSELG